MSVNQIVTRAVWFRMRAWRPAAFPVPSPRHASPRGSASPGTDQGSGSGDLLDEIGDDEAQLAELAGAWASMAISTSEWLTACQAIKETFNQQRARLVRSDRQRALRAVAGHGDQLRRRWASSISIRAAPSLARFFTRL